MASEEDVTCPLHKGFTGRLEKVEEFMDTIKTRTTATLIIIVLGILGFFSTQVYFHVNQPSTLSPAQISSIVEITVEKMKK